MMTKDAEIADSISRVRQLVELHGWFKPAPNRSDGMLIGQGKWDGWQLEMRFVHGEGTVDLMYGRTAGERVVKWRALQAIRSEWTGQNIIDWFTIQYTRHQMESE
jgi:hypothetical protein